VPSQPGPAWSFRSDCHRSASHPPTGRLPFPDSRCAAMSRDRSQGVADDLRQLVGGLGG
jgi:hypothetical protein